jgi:hypothetical protein
MKVSAPGYPLPPLSYSFLAARLSLVSVSRFLFPAIIRSRLLLAASLLERRFGSRRLSFGEHSQVILAKLPPPCARGGEARERGHVGGAMWAGGRARSILGHVHREGAGRRVREADMGVAIAGLY